MHRAGNHGLGIDHTADCTILGNPEKTDFSLVLHKARHIRFKIGGPCQEGNQRIDRRISGPHVGHAEHPQLLRKRVLASHWSCVPPDTDLNQ
jgi:hypothetical protein